MPPWIDFQLLKTQVSLETVLLDYYALDTLRRRGHRLVGPCPLHGGDNPHAFHADLNTNLWHCFTRCGRGGDQLTFVALREDISIRDAALRLADFIGLNGARSIAHPPRPPPPRPVAEAPSINPPLAFRLTLDPRHPHLQNERGLTVATCRHFGVGYAQHGMLRGMIAVPIHDANGQLVAYIGRRLDPEATRRFGKYRLPRGFHKELVLYNKHRCHGWAASHGLIVVEGIFTVLALHAAGYPNVVATLGCHLSDAQAALLTHAAEVSILFDPDAAGQRGAEQARERLRVSHTSTRILSLEAEEDPERLDSERLRTLLGAPPWQAGG